MIDLRRTDPYRAMRLATLMRALERDDVDFVPILHDPAAVDPARPLLILVHPGDLVQHPGCWASQAEERAALDFWQHCGSGTMAELRAHLRAGGDVAVLHRASSEALSHPVRRYGLAAALWKALSPVHRGGTVLWGDDLAAAGDWILAHLAVADRPAIHLAGAYSCPRHGCLTAIGSRLLAHVPADRMHVSPFSPPGNGPGPVWRPDGSRPEMPLPGALRAAFAALAAPQPPAA